MDGAKARRRRLALATLGALAVLGFAAGAVLGSGSGGGPGGSAGLREVHCAEAGTTAGGCVPKVEIPAGAAAMPVPTPADPLTPAQLAGERIVVGLDGTGLTPALKGAIRDGKVAGVVLFEADFPSRAAGRELIRALQAVARPKPLRRFPLLVMTDQEGGEVKRVDGAPEASAATMGAEGPAFAHREGSATAKNLRALGVNVDLAPVLDVGRPGGVIEETERAFGTTAGRVAATAVPFATGLQAGGVAATAKHFPGLGTATENTDFEAQRLDLSKAELRSVDEAPYRPYIAAGGKLVMVGTAIYPAFGSRPAAFNRRIVTGELRGRLGFHGVTITDSLGSAAVAEFGGQREAAVDGVSAGDDLLLFDDLPSALAGHEALVKQLAKGALKRPPFLDAANRVLRLRGAVGRASIG
ncbi:MAG TPA: glycoside hydrolase family 3 N-terminal domain-containing protein [Solirubrobacterales bacterium]|jgi:beta-N-acetylhexosaminidase|nr:glycoside hydrolase family 3 N-terminal domain-containing protein [Solirubrobacterales bacterium]